MNGKDKCALLKSIRVRLAEINNITYTPHPCNNTMECNGTCELCEAESKRILDTMKEREKKGYPILYSLNELDEISLGVSVNSYLIDNNCGTRR